MTKKATELGKALRKIRVENDEPMRSMAEKLGFSTSFLSAVELGQKALADPIVFLNKVAELYSLDNTERTELDEAAARSLYSVPLPLNQENGQMLMGLARAAHNGNFDELMELLNHEQSKKMET